MSRVVVFKDMEALQRTKKWVLADEQGARGKMGEGKDAHPAIPPGIQAMLAARGIREPEAIDSFFGPSLTDLPDPFLMKGMATAVDTLIEALVENRPIVVFGDYDVDGVTGAAVIALFLKEVGGKFLVCHPDRQRHGYGLHEQLITELASQTMAESAGAVLLTVDCGISNNREVEFAKALGFKVIITDHHQLPAVLPEADTILNPLQSGCDFPYKTLAGVGVAFYLLVGLRAEMRNKDLFSTRKEPNLKKSLDLVAIGTVCDMVPLTGVNRLLVKAGMEVLRDSERVGLQALKKVAGLQPSVPISVEDIGFRIGPRINAAGRLDDAQMAYRLLVTEQEGEAQVLAKELDSVNEARKGLTEEVFQSCCRKIEELQLQERVTLVIFGEDWHPGVLGIVASKLVQKYYLPTVLLSRTMTEAGTQILKGSARSIEGFNIFEALQQCEENLEKFGGHSQAAGLTIKSENFDLFSTTFEEIARMRIKKEDLLESVEIYDVSKILRDDAASFLDYYRKMEPFGIGNPEPVFAAFGCHVRDSRVVGEKHLSFTMYQKNSKLFPTIAFNRGSLLPHLLDKEIDIAFTLRLNQFRGRESWQACMVDIGNHPSN